MKLEHFRLKLNLNKALKDDSSKAIVAPIAWRNKVTLADELIEDGTPDGSYEERMLLNGVTLNVMYGIIEKHKNEILAEVVRQMNLCLDNYIAYTNEAPKKTIIVSIQYTNYEVLTSSHPKK